MFQLLRGYRLRSMSRESESFATIRQPASLGFWVQKWGEQGWRSFTLLNDTIFSPVSSQAIGCVTHLSDYMAHQYFLREEAVYHVIRRVYIEEYFPSVYHIVR